jgi:hypothetical protein
MNCPHCGSADLRHSEKIAWSDVPHRAMGRRPWRCRECRRRFYAAPNDETPAARPRKPSKQRSINGSRRRRRRAIEAGVLGLLLLIFLLFLRYLTREPAAEDSGQVRGAQVCSLV